MTSAKSNSTPWLVLAIVSIAMIAACTPASQNDGAVPGTNDDENTVPENIVDDAKNDFQRMFGNEPDEYMVKYVVTRDEGDKQNVGEMSFYQKSENTRSDFKGMTDEQVSEMRTYTLDSSYITCFMQEEWQCIKTDKSQADEVTQDPSESIDQVMEEMGNVTIQKLESRAIAGTTAECYNITYNNNQDLTDEIICAKDAVMLYMEATTSEGRTVLEATQYSRNVPDSDFVPPATAQDIGDYIGTQ